MVVSVLMNEHVHEAEFHKVSFHEEFKAEFSRKVLILRGFPQFFFCSSDNLIGNSEKRPSGAL